MKLRKDFFLVAMIILVNHLQAQTLVFRAIVIHNRNGRMNDFRILANSTTTITNDAGIFTIPIDDKTTFVKVALEKNDYSILYPSGGHIPVPRNLDDLPEIIIGSPKDNLLLSQYLKLSKQLEKMNDDKSSGNKYLQDQFDSIRSLLLQMNYSDTELRNEKEMQNNRDRWYKEISETLNQYINRAIDLEVGFKYLTGVALVQPEARDKLRSAVNAYNEVSESLYRNRQFYGNCIENYWQNDSLSADFRSLLSFALDSIHANTFSKLQSDIAYLNDIPYRSKDSNREQTLKKSISEHIAVLHPMLAVLRNKNERFQNEFSN